MISRENAIKALLSADATLTGILTGGIYTRHELGKQGLKADNSLASSAYALDDGFKVLQPCVVIRLRSDVPDGNRFDAQSQTVSSSGTLELYFYDESAFETIETARDRAYRLLHAKTNTSIGHSLYINGMMFYDEPINDAACLKDDYKLTYRLGG